MALVKLSTEVAVNPQSVASTEVKRGYQDSVLVTMDDGRTYSISPQYRETIWEAFDRVNGLLSDAQVQP